MRWHYRDPPLLWLFAAAYVAHVVEEFVAGFPQWFALVVESPLPVAAFVAINVAGLTLLVTAIRAAARRETAGWAAVAIATVAAVNAAAHLAGSILTSEYSPGLFTGVVLYVPLALLTLTRALHQMPRSAFRRGVASGVAVQATAFGLAVVATRLG